MSATLLEVPLFYSEHLNGPTIQLKHSIFYVSIHSTTSSTVDILQICECPGKGRPQCSM